MSGAIPPLPDMPSWCGAQLKESTGTTLPLPFILYLTCLNFHKYYLSISHNKWPALLSKSGGSTNQFSFLQCKCKNVLHLDGF
jgi:hypothetical protein